MDAKGREFGIGARIVDTEVMENGTEVTGQMARSTGVRPRLFALPCSRDGYGAGYFPISESAGLFPA
jgi:hypothetical protein